MSRSDSVVSILTFLKNSSLAYTYPQGLQLFIIFSSISSFNLSITNAYLEANVSFSGLSTAIVFTLGFATIYPSVSKESLKALTYNVSILGRLIFSPKLQL